MGSQRMASREHMPPDADKRSPASVIGMTSGFAAGEQITAKDMNTNNDDDIDQRFTKLLNVDNSLQSFEKIYTLKTKLMSGFFGTVYTGVHNSTGEKYAVKVVERSDNSKKQLMEVDILLSLTPRSLNQIAQHSSECGHNEFDVYDNGVINLVDFYHSPTKYHIVMELARGGDVFDRLAKRKVYTEKNTRDLAVRMLQSIKFLHDRGIAHRDIKPDNLLLMYEECDTSLKLADFGLARRFSLNDPDTSMKTLCGTPAFAPPEIVRGVYGRQKCDVSYGAKCDVWSAGVTLFNLLMGHSPFDDDDTTEMKHKIINWGVGFKDNDWSGVSANAKDLILSMTQVDPKARISAEEALQSDWINTAESNLRSSNLENTLREIKSFNARRKWKGAINLVRISTRQKFWDTSSARRKLLVKHQSAEDVATSRHDHRDIESGVHDESETLLKDNYSDYSLTKTVRFNFHQLTKTIRFNDKDQNYDRDGCQEMPQRMLVGIVRKKMYSIFVMLELLISNMPSLIGALALAWTSLGGNWFKWYEETSDTCVPIDYHNEGCTYPEYSGCFTCDTSSTGYRFSVSFHYLCSSISFVFASCLVGKVLIAFPVVRDELANPTTAAPIGLLCMALDKCFAGNFGIFGQAVTFLSSAAQTVVAIWFIYISVVFGTLPEPTWFPNTTGIGIAAVKVFLYWTMGGYILSIGSLVAFLMFYVVALYRLHTNEKISAIVCWLQLSGPAVVLYAVSIFGQPGSDIEEMSISNPENKEQFLEFHRKYLMPLIHLLFACCMISMASALYCLKTRWASIQSKEFSPAHVGFCAPLISHTNAIQVYRGTLNKFSLSSPNALFESFLYQYWCLSLICGTVLSVILTYKFLKNLPSWCQIDEVEDELAPLPGEENILTRLLQEGETAPDEMNQHFVSAAVLQANESGGLVRVLRDGEMKIIRSRRMPSMGFDLTMNTRELRSERDLLLQHMSYAADPSRRGGIASFSANTIRKSKRASFRKNLNFISFDASTWMRGEDSNI